MATLIIIAMIGQVVNFFRCEMAGEKLLFRNLLSFKYVVYVTTLCFAEDLTQDHVSLSAMSWGFMV